MQCLDCVSFVFNRCLKDETLKVFSSTGPTFQFGVQAFKFTGNFDQVTQDEAESWNIR